MSTSTSKLQGAMLAKLQGAQFRQLNEKLYTQSSGQSFKMMKKEPKLFETYHAGFRSQVSGWPVNPLDVIIDEVRKAAPGSVVADMGCGEARLAATVDPKPPPHPALAARGPTVHSFDLVCPPGNPYVVPCDVSATPLERHAADAVVFCLSLMGTNYAEFLREADRVLKPGGKLLIAEVRSRFEARGGGDAGGGGGGGGGGDAAPTGKHAGQKRPRQEESPPPPPPPAGGAAGITVFVDGVRGMGYKLTRRDESNTMFVLLFFRKSGGEQPGMQGQGAGVGRREGGAHGGAAATLPAPLPGGPGRADGKKKRSKHNKFQRAEGGAGGGGTGRGAMPALPSLKACIYKKR